MSERDSRLYSLPERLYIENAPLTVAAGALLKDNSTGRVLAQLKFKNICEKPIKAVTVRIQPLDTVSRPLGGTVEFQYLDLNAPRDSEFGQQTPVWLPDAATRSFSVQVIEVAFANNTLWSDSINIWEPLPAPAPLAERLGDAELARQYRLTYGDACQFAPTEAVDLWYCTCGALNRGNEDKCHTCGRSLSEYRSIDLKALAAAKDARLKQEAAERAEAQRLAEEQRAREQAEAEERRAREAEAAAKAQAAAEAHAKKVKKIAMIVTPLVVAAAVLAVLTVKVFIPNSKYNAKYNAAQTMLENGQYEEAMTSFRALGKYKDSRSYYQVLYALFGDQITTVENFASRIDQLPESMFKEAIQSRYIDPLTDLVGEWHVLNNESETLSVYDNYYFSLAGNRQRSAIVFYMGNLYMESINKTITDFTDQCFTVTVNPGTPREYIIQYVRKN